ncbi:hypothetical protein IB642_00175 [Allofrancisella guangzhouensis]|uniref:Amidohydrolase-related domain-containing protein n=1 Tax=Allofrancisella guangzhouensis TaxID=594679 RepID=A0A0A8E556_9GAMM|nr:DUF6282 family protein [Allofrancisella guangzhouensis]AJC48737.1 hypothetical protein SD28_03315 [Allofrancisella guangzhouensis]MBK2027382.1 hypothetical protein [Allofrancisella guangzhouensis]MBK2043433.1 hypothetical protein [Allofrancisella guangzhouensis]MBK2045202.1 hypothetical protein [Allofrancisella guangzhouensis]
MLNVNFIDIHYHASPDLFLRRENPISAGKKYQELGGAVVLKSHLGSTVQAAEIARAQGLPVLPSVVLNDIAGGLSRKTVLHALSEYTCFDKLRILVHLPTLKKTQHESKLIRSYSNQWAEKYASKPSSICIDNTLKDEVIDILKMSKDYPIVVTSGHASKDEVLLLLEECAKLNIDRFMLNQPANPMTGLTVKELSVLSDQYEFLWIEQCALTYALKYQSWDDMEKVLKNVPRVIYSSDFGQKSQPSIADWYLKSKEWFESMKLSKKRIKDITLNNPLEMLKV